MLIGIINGVHALQLGSYSFIRDLLTNANILQNKLLIKFHLKREIVSILLWMQILHLIFIKMMVLFL